MIKSPAARVIQVDDESSGWPHHEAGRTFQSHQADCLPDGLRDGANLLWRQRPFTMAAALVAGLNDYFQIQTNEDATAAAVGQTNQMASVFI
jgi:hypothetical protein